MTVGAERTNEDLRTNQSLLRKDVLVTFRFVPAAKVFELFDRLEADASLGRGFVDSVSLSPTVGGFSGEMNYTIIHVKSGVQ